MNGLFWVLNLLSREQEEDVLKAVDKTKKLDFEGFYKLVEDKSERNLLNDSKLLEPRHQSKETKKVSVVSWLSSHL